MRGLLELNLWLIFAEERNEKISNTVSDHLEANKETWNKDSV